MVFMWFCGFAGIVFFVGCISHEYVTPLSLLSLPLFWTDRLSAVNLVENIRQVAMEARMVLVESFGEGSDVVNEFQRDLQPVFRPGSKIET